MTAASWALQTALYAHLSADAALAAEIGDPPRVYDDPPAEAAYPYLVIGEGRETPLSGHDGAVEHDIRIRIVSRWKGRREVRRLIDLLYDALHDADLDVSGRRLVSIRFVFGDAFRRDAVTFTGVVRFRAVTEAA